MFRSFYLSAILLLGAAAVFGQHPMGHAAPQNGCRAPPPPVTEEQTESLSTNGIRMSLEDRQKQLAKLPPAHRKWIEDQLNQYKNMTPAERRQWRSQIEMFGQLPPAKQQQARRLWGQFGQMPKERQTSVRSEFDTLRNLPESQRGARFNSDEFRSKYTASEQKFLRDMSGLLSPPK